MNWQTFILSILSFWIAIAEVQAQQNDPIESAFFPPELVMQHQKAIGITAEQEQAILEAFEKTQSAFSRFQWQLQKEVQNMAEIVQNTKVDEAAAAAQLDKVLALEKEIKHLQISLMIKIKNQLTTAQQDKLQQIKQDILEQN